MLTPRGKSTLPGKKKSHQRRIKPTTLYQAVERLLFVGCLTYQQHASVPQGRICSDNFTCCQTEIEAVDQTFYLTQSQYTDTGPTSPSADPRTPGVWQGITRPGSLTRPVASGIRTRDLPLSRRTP